MTARGRQSSCTARVSVVSWRCASCGPTAVSGKRVVGFIDDDQARQRTLIHGVPVLGTGVDLEAVARAQHAAAIVVATRKLTDDRVNEVLRVAGRLGLSVYRLAIDLEPLEAPTARTAALPARLPKVSQTTPLQR